MCPSSMRQSECGEGRAVSRAENGCRPGSSHSSAIPLSSTLMTHASSQAPGLARGLRKTRDSKGGFIAVSTIAPLTLALRTVAVAIPSGDRRSAATSRSTRCPQRCSMNWLVFIAPSLANGPAVGPALVCGLALWGGFLCREVGLLQVGDLLIGKIDLELEVLVHGVHQAAALRFDHEILELLETCVPLVE